jgi:hypothetical protein
MKNYFYTSSLNMTAWLHSKRFEIVNIVKLDKPIFYFTRTDELEKSINDYNNNIELKTFIGAFRYINQLTK